MTDVFTDKVIIITGASEGIGRALAIALAARKTKLALVARNGERLRELAEDCHRLGSEALVVVADLSEADACRLLVEKTVAHFGGIDVLVNNAGMTMWANFADTRDAALIERVMRINYLSAAYCTHFALPYLLARRGRIVAVSSLSGYMAVPGHAIYGASKHALHGLFESLRVELRSTGVSVTLVAPDFVATNLHKRGFKADGTSMDKQLDRAKYMAPEVCARMVLKAIQRRQRILITSQRGRLAFFLRGVIPQVLDAFAIRGARRAHLT